MYDANEHFIARIAQRASRLSTGLGNRGSGASEFGYVPLYLVKNVQAQPSADRQQYDIREFYRGKDTPAAMPIGKHPGILQEADTRYYLNLLWGLEPKLIP